MTAVRQTGARQIGRAYAVVGDPVSHSLSPLIHNLWLKKAGVDAVYSAVHLQSANAAEDIRRMSDMGFHGLNVTLPHKQAALQAAAKRSPGAERIGAANTLARENDGTWTAFNTDIDGFSSALHHVLGKSVARGRVVLIGSGGAARAAVVHLAEAGADLAIVNRTEANARQLADELAPDAETAGMEALPRLAIDADVVVNSASLGHAGDALPVLPAGRGRPFLDMSYGRAAAGALMQAEASGWTPHDGFRMLVGQAAAAFRIWFGIDPDEDAALAACQEAVRARA